VKYEKIKINLVIPRYNHDLQNLKSLSSSSSPPLLLQQFDLVYIQSNTKSISKLYSSLFFFFCVFSIIHSVASRQWKVEGLLSARRTPLAAGYGSRGCRCVTGQAPRAMLMHTTSHIVPKRGITMQNSFLRRNRWCWYSRGISRWSGQSRLLLITDA
jgi:hypothetical protein